MKQLVSRLERKSLSHPIIEYEQQRVSENTRIEQRIDVWFSLWLMAQLSVLAMLLFLGTRLRRHGTPLLEIGFEDSWLLAPLCVQWVALLATAAGTTYYAIGHWSLIRRRMLVLGAVPWAVMATETLGFLFWTL
jgi:hypothetical protein